MAEIIKTWPANMNARTIQRIMFDDPFSTYFFTLGRGKPKEQIDRLWFTYQGRILGSFKVERISINDGSFPRLSRLDGGESDWQLKPDVWVAICNPPCDRLQDRLFMSGFRGWRYFNLQEYRQTTESKVRL